ncbi:protein shisa-5 isoform X3 [Sitodiplosis mosellana]|uniref:protein shisa-5 isoform X3 n=1 Tax=Sitodiplosis mosellana TaxID=263140 RepID=UPI002443EE52|nr:protein shisa-5 isoform X3 [Sitodiplosis mosellana]
MHTFHHEDHSFNSMTSEHVYPFVIVVIVVLTILAFFFALIYSIAKCIHKSLRYRYRFVSSPVVVTTTTIPTVPQSAGYPAQSTIVQGYPMPQPQPGYPPQPAGMYPNQPMPQPYPMPPIQADYNPPSYDQVVRGGDAYQKQAPYNPNYSGQQ